MFRSTPNSGSQTYASCVKYVKKGALLPADPHARQLAAMPPPPPRTPFSLEQMNFSSSWGSPPAADSRHASPLARAPLVADSRHARPLARAPLTADSRRASSLARAERGEIVPQPTRPAPLMSPQRSPLAMSPLAGSPLLARTTAPNLAPTQPSTALTSSVQAVQDQVARLTLQVEDMSKRQLELDGALEAESSHKRARTAEAEASTTAVFELRAELRTLAAQIQAQQAAAAVHERRTDELLQVCALDPRREAKIDIFDLFCESDDYGYSPVDDGDLCDSEPNQTLLPPSSPSLTPTSSPPDLELRHSRAGGLWPSAGRPSPPYAPRKPSTRLGESGDPFALPLELGRPALPFEKATWCTPSGLATASVDITTRAGAACRRGLAPAFGSLDPDQAAEDTTGAASLFDDMMLSPTY
ncbi:hypothetical protein T492DRAFT_836252 [Pavlovales sp. CCMP2436]|nr:hypothetical protein T492DRAFT_836252 [Pavlovales sp. CCMP2436]